MRTEIVVGHLAKARQARGQQGSACSYQLTPPDPTMARRKGSILVVAGPAAGCEDGGRASHMTADMIRERYYAAASDYPIEALRQAMIAANAALYEAARGSGHQATGTAAACVVVQHGNLVVGEVGQCQAYLLREGRLQPLTGDGVTAAMGDGEGSATEAGTPAARRAPTLAQALGAGPQVEPRVTMFGNVRDGDRLLLCTDGLPKAVDAADLTAALADYPPQAACRRLAELADAVAGVTDLALLVARIRVELDSTPGEPSAGAPGRANIALDGRWPAIEARERALVEYEQGLLEREQALQTREDALEEGEQALVRAQVALAARERILAEREQRLLAREAALGEPAPEEGEVHPAGPADVEPPLAAEPRAEAPGEQPRLVDDTATEACAAAQDEQKPAEFEGAVAAQQPAELEGAQEPAGPGGGGERPDGPQDAEETGERLAAGDGQSPEAGPAAGGQTLTEAHLSLLQGAWERQQGELNQVAAGLTALQQAHAALQAEMTQQWQELMRQLTEPGEQMEAPGAAGGSPAPDVSQPDNALPGDVPSAVDGGTRSLHLQQCELAFVAEENEGEFRQEYAIELPDGRVVTCGLAAQRDSMRRQFPMALEVWAHCGESRAERLVVGYGLDLRTLPPGLVQGRGLAVIVNGDEIIGLRLGSLLVHAAVTQCEFATSVQHKVACDQAAFLALRVCFQVVTGP